MKQNTVAFCGYDCKNCPIYLATQYNNIELLKQIVVTHGVSITELTVEKLGCYGCTDSKTVNIMCSNCPIRICAKQKQVENCGWCSTFPCEKLNYISESTKDYLNKIKNSLEKKGK